MTFQIPSLILRKRHLINQIYLFQSLLALGDIWIPQKSSFRHPDGINFIKIKFNLQSSVCNPLQFSSYYDFHILPDHDRHPSAISPRMPSLELHFRHRKCSPLYFRAPPFPTCLFPHAGGKYFVTCFCIQEMLSENQLLMKTMPKAQRT